MSRRLRWAAAAALAATLAAAGPAFAASAAAAETRPYDDPPAGTPGLITLHVNGGETSLVVDAKVLLSLGGLNLVRLSALLELGTPLAADIDLALLESLGVVVPQAPALPTGGFRGPTLPRPSWPTFTLPAGPQAPGGLKLPVGLTQAPVAGPTAPTPTFAPPSTIAPPPTSSSTSSSSTTSSSTTSTSSTSSTTSTTIQLPTGAQSAPIQIATNRRGVTVRAVVTPSELGLDDGVATVTFIVTNGSDEQVTDLHLLNVVSAGGTASSARSTSGGSCAVVGGKIDCALGDLAPGEQVTITAEVSLASADGSLLLQEASINGTGLGVPLKLTLSTSIGDAGDQQPGLQVLGFPGTVVTTLGMVSFVFAASMTGDHRVLSLARRR